MLQFSAARESWPIAGSFTIARGSKTSAEVVTVTLQRGEYVGRGEAVPYARYNETVDGVLQSLKVATTAIINLRDRESISALNLPFAARNALDCAMWDLQSKETAKPVWQLAGLNEPSAVTTAFTLSLDTPENMAAAARAAANRTLLKLKLGRDGDEARLDAVRRAAPHSRLIVDANEGWSKHQLGGLLRHCKSVDVELVEQPLPAAEDDYLKGLTRPIPLCADESAHGVATLPDLIGKYDAINIKLDKTGGLTPALAFAKAAKAAIFKIMLGCMLATSLAMAPAFLLAQFADYIDLDGPLLLKQDRQPGISYDGSIMQPPPRELWG